MKKIIIIVAIVSLFIGIGASALELKTLKVNSWVLKMDVFTSPNNIVKKFIDGNNTCYVITGTIPNLISMSCVKN